MTNQTASCIIIGGILLFIAVFGYVIDRMLATGNYYNAKLTNFACENRELNPGDFVAHSYHNNGKTWIYECPDPKFWEDFDKFAYDLGDGFFTKFQGKEIIK